MKSLLIVLAILCLGLFGCNKNTQSITKSTSKQVVSEGNWHYDGEVLYPKNEGDDTLIVIRANYLNYLLNQREFRFTDKAVTEALKNTCTRVNGRVLDLPEEYEANNHFDDLTTVISKDTIHIYFQ